MLLTELWVTDSWQAISWQFSDIALSRNYEEVALLLICVTNTQMI